MNLADSYLQFLAVLLAMLMGTVEFVNWLNRKRGGFMKGWAGSIFIAVCWAAALTFIALRVRS